MWGRSSSAIRSARALLSAAALVVACEGGVDHDACYPGDFQACTCAAAQPGVTDPRDPQPGYARCADDGASFGGCDCTGAVVPTVAASSGAGGAGGEGGEGGAALLPFMADCELDAECETGLCHVFAAKGPKCSKACATAADCPPPSPGCNNMGICKAP